MNVFEDLLTDLKQENLLEDTVLDDPADRREFDDSEVNFESPIAARAEQQSADAPAVIVTRNDDSPAEPVQNKPSANGREFFKKRAIAEVANLQMVEHVLTGVEREYMKIKPQIFDDLKAKLALNKFIKVSDQEVASDEHKTGEIQQILP